MGDICKYNQSFWSLHNSFFHKLYPKANNLPYTDEELHLINHKNVQVINQLRTLDSAFSLGEGKNSKHLNTS